MDTSTLAIEVNGISKSYDKVKALDHVSLEVQRGEIYGLIGPDGAGRQLYSKYLSHCSTPTKETQKSMVLMWFLTIAK